MLRRIMVELQHKFGSTINTGRYMNEPSRKLIDKSTHAGKAPDHIGETLEEQILSEHQLPNPRQGLPLTSSNILQLQCMLGNQATTQLLTNQAGTNKSLIQRQIGPNLQVGDFVKKGPKGAPWKITKTAIKNGLLQYTVEWQGGLISKDVMEDDTEWHPANPPQLNPREQKTFNYISTRIAQPVVGTVASWIQPNESADTAVSKGLKMTEEATTNDTLKYLWTGGAADCVAVGGYNNNVAYLTHADRSSVGSAVQNVLALGNGVQVYLSNQMVQYGAQTAATSGMLQDIVEDLQKNNINAAIYGTGRLALNGSTGAVLSQFPNP